MAFGNFDLDNLDNLNFALGGLEEVTVLTQAEYEANYRDSKVAMNKKDSEEFVDLKTEVGEDEVDRMKESGMSFYQMQP